VCKTLAAQHGEKNENKQNKEGEKFVGSA